ncbi:hypothetical protein K438DRAFT_1722563 [Mycena galopus ATCC 62051]|nr:hypothetical protein K438DRAFT_1722563 [Mycena galopus ATCC 62051]
MHLLVFLIHVLAVTRSCSSTTLVTNTISAQNATVKALVYGLPLQPYVALANFTVNSSGGWTTNLLLHATALANASHHTLALPNVDTLYSQGLLDLSGGDLIATMPSLEPGRFYVWPFYDLYGNNVCNIGTMTHSTEGKYLIQYRASNPGCGPGTGEYAGTIYLPTVYGATLLRIEVSNSSDVAYVVSSIQPGFSLASGPPEDSRAPTLTEALFNDNIDTSNSPLSILQRLARLAAYNPPEDASQVSPIAAIMAAAGISLSQHTYTPPTDVDLAAAYASALGIADAVAQTPADWLSLGDGWASSLPALAGDFHAHYDVRAFTAVDAYLELQATQAVYPTYTATENFYSNQTYMVQFFGKPQVNGFWSFTMYDGEGFLVPNSINRYSLNDRGNMTYPDGTLVYGGNSPSDSAESFYMLLQSTDLTVSAEWESNWLPTPADAQQFQFFLRWYGPTDSLINGTYQYPKVTAASPNPPLPTST